MAPLFGVLQCDGLCSADLYFELHLTIEMTSTSLINLKWDLSLLEKSLEI